MSDAVILYQDGSLWQLLRAMAAQGWRLMHTRRCPSCGGRGYTYYGPETDDCGWCSGDGEQLALRDIARVLTGMAGHWWWARIGWVPAMSFPPIRCPGCRGEGYITCYLYEQAECDGTEHEDPRRPGSPCETARLFIDKSIYPPCPPCPACSGRLALWWWELPGAHRRWQAARGGGCGY